MIITNSFSDPEPSWFAVESAIINCQQDDDWLLASVLPASLCLNLWVDFSSTLQVGDRAPSFTLRAANDSSEHTLLQAMASGPAIIEFLRGTW